jgi:hypothetical protein
MTGFGYREIGRVSAFSGAIGERRCLIWAVRTDRHARVEHVTNANLLY